jgi:acid phosphatase family membrane protein YuiD
MYLIAPAVGFVIAKILKVAGYVRADKNYLKKNGWRVILTGSGGMPSEHSTTVAALATYIGLANGINAPTFALAVVFAIIVMYDAQQVRRATGENGLALAKIIKEKFPGHWTPYYAKGHTTREVAAGCVIGIIVGVATWFIVK